MATNKHAQIRYNTLDKCFRNPGRNYTIDDLLEECNNAIFEFDDNAEGIKRRQLYDDLNYMQSESGWSIELAEGLKIGRKKIYRYVDTGFSISSQPLNEADANQLKAALITLSRFKGLPQFDWVEELSVRLDDSFNLTKDAREIIGFEENEFLKGKEHITQLYNAIHYKKVLIVKYKSFNSDYINTFTLSPYYLKQYNNRWFLLGRDTRFKTLTILALDRMESIDETDQKYMRTDIDFNEYFEDIIGVSVLDAPVEKILLRIPSKAINYISTKPLHGSQKIRKEKDSHHIVELEVIPNYELESMILSYGELMEVIEPVTLRNKLKERTKALSSFYQLI